MTGTSHRQARFLHVITQSMRPALISVARRQPAVNMEDNRQIAVTEPDREGGPDVQSDCHSG